MLNPADYFKEYRSAIGFSSQGAAKSFLSAKDIAPGVDYDYIVSLNQRIQEVLVRVNDIAEASFKRDDMEAFCRQHVFRSYSIIKDANLLTRLNNQGGARRTSFFMAERLCCLSIFHSGFRDNI